MDFPAPASSHILLLFLFCCSVWLTNDDDEMSRRGRRTYVSSDVEMSSLVRVRVGDDVQLQQRVLHVRRLMTQSDVGDRLTKPWTRFHTCYHHHPVVGCMAQRWNAGLSPLFKNFEFYKIHTLYIFYLSTTEQCSLYIHQLVKIVFAAKANVGLKSHVARDK